MKFPLKPSYLLLSAILVLIVVNVPSCATFGYDPSAEKIQSYTRSPNYDVQREQFVNRNQALVDRRNERPMPWDFIWDRLFNRNNGAPTTKLPEDIPNFSLFTADEKAFKIIWLGHSSILLNLNGIIVLIDPVFGSASPFKSFATRFQAPVVTVEQLPIIDYIVISHDHYDHLEMETIQFYAKTDTTFVVPLGVSSHLSGWGVSSDNIIEKDWWQEATFEDIRFISTPSQHFSGRSGPHTNTTLWSSWVIQTADHNIYFSGDTGYHEQFKEIGSKYGPFDIAFVETGQYNDLWREIHLFPEEAVVAFKELNAERYFPIHWGMFQLAPHRWDASIIEIDDLSDKEGIQLIAPIIGAITDLNQPFRLDKWWQLVK